MMKTWSLRSASGFGSVGQRTLRNLISALMLFIGATGYAAACERTLTADVVALDMPLMWNRLGAQNINGMMYALKRDIVKLPQNTPITGLGDEELQTLVASGRIALRPDKRPRPLVLRMGAGDCMELQLTNLLRPEPNPFNIGDTRSGIDFQLFNNDQVGGRRVSLRFQGTQLVTGIGDDGSNVGVNADSTIPPGGTMTYSFFAEFDGTFVGTSYGDVTGGEGLGGQTASGLFAVLNVGPKDMAFYRTQTTNEELELATTGYTETGHPIIDYEAVYPDVEPWSKEGKAGLPILNMVRTVGDTHEIVHNQLDAIIAYGPDFELATVDDGGYGGPSGGYDSYLGHFPADTYPLESQSMRNPTVPNRLEPFREFTVAFHDEVQTKQAFPGWYEDQVFRHTLHGVKDAFMINYGSGGIGSEILANRFRVGPMHDCVNCAYEEFFLSFHTVGEVGQLTDIPANAGLENCLPTLVGCGATGPKANYILYPDDPSNVHHTYQGDAVAFRNTHVGPGEQHVFHLHNHQWLFNADDPDSNYLDAQGLGPGSGYGYWVNFGGSGNRNKSAGDAIFHCHFYPHFAQGMWEMWRIHDTFEPGTELQATLDGMAEGLDAHLPFTADLDNDGLPDGIGVGNGTPADVDNDGFVRALPDGEVVVGAPTPAIIPLPGKAMAPMPAIDIRIVENKNTVKVCVVDDATKGTADEQRVLRRSDNGMCPGGSAEVNRAAGSLVEVARIDRAVDKGYGDDAHKRYGVYGPDGNLGADEYGNIDDVNPGYPFWIAGMEHSVGNRPPTPPLDMITHEQAQQLKWNSANPYHDLWKNNSALDNANAVDGWDGGLPRFSIQGYSAGGETVAAVSRLDMSKEIHRARPVFFPEEGTDLEQIAMGHHARRCHDTTRIERDIYVEENNGYYGESAECVVDPDGGGYEVGLSGNLTHGGFITNGNLPVPGAPFFEPCMDDRGVLMTGGTGSFFDGKSNAPIWATSAMGTEGSSPYTALGPRVYKAANVQFDAVLNKLGYHFPQQRIIALWHDVVPTIKQERPPEPFVMRLNTFDCAQYVHSNVVPKAYELDDYQVRTPTDIIGQHIHLPKWDLVSADGSGNGWNYEDGTLSPEAIIEMIHAINEWNVEAFHGNIVLKDKYGQDVVAKPVTSVFSPTTLPRAVNDSTGNNELELYPASEDDVKLSYSVDHPFFGQTEFAHKWVGARSTIQRWFADPVVNIAGVDRGLGIIFTHDHYGPSTHQQVGLYATLLVEPAGSKWVHNETGTELYTRTGREPVYLNDGGPTSWQAAILTNEDGRYSSNVKHEFIESHREFYFEYSDFQHAYQPGVFVGIQYNDSFNWSSVIKTPEYFDDNGDGIAENPIDDDTLTDFDKNTFRDALQPPLRLQAPILGGQPVIQDGVAVNEGGFPVDIWEFPAECAPSNRPRPCPEAITANDPGLYVVNYRNESLAARIYDPGKVGPDGRNGTQADGRAGDLAFAMSSKVNRKIPELNSVMGLAPAGYFDSTCETSVGGVEVFCPPITNPDALAKGDPFTPMARVVDGDRVHLKMQAGGQEEEHGFTVHGLRWLQGGSGFGEDRNSGWRNAQAGGISEQFSLKMPVFADWQQRGNVADYAYSANPSIDGWVSGTWGILRSYKPSSAADLEPLPNEMAANVRFGNGSDFNGVCPIDAPVREYDITAISVNDALAPAPDVEIKDWFPGLHVGASPDPDGGTLVYNPRTTDIQQGTAGEVNGAFSSGPLHDPTGIIYVHTSDLIAKRAGATTFGRGRNKTVVPDDPYCWEPQGDGKWSFEPSLQTCQVMLDPNATLEPVVIRANAGDCIEVTLRNRVLQPAYVEANEQEGYQHDGDYLIFDANGDLIYENLFALAEEEQEAEAGGVDSIEAVESDDLIWRADIDFDGIVDDGSVDLEDVDMLIDPTSEIFASVVFDQTMDLANGNALGGAVRRDPGGELQPDGTVNGMTTFNNNLMQPSAHVGMRPQLVEYDVSRSDGFNVGQNNKQTAPPGGSITYDWYAGILSRETIEEQRRRRTITSTVVTAKPIEFGGFNIFSADPIEQGQKGLVAAGVIYPQGSTWTVDEGRNTAATVTANGKTFRDFTTVAAKGLSLVYGDSFPLENVLGEGTFGVAEDSQDMGHMAINFGNEAMWFRYGINPTEASGNANCNGAFDPNANPDNPEPAPCLGGLRTDDAVLAYSNDLTGGDPETAVFNVIAGTEFRMHVLMPFAPGRGSTFDLHGHVFQRDPYVCPETTYGLEGYCNPGNGLPGSGSVGSQNLGLNPVGFHLGGIESWFAGEHYEIFIPSAGGVNGIVGDYLFRDHMGLGNTGGLWGILRVE